MWTVRVELHRATEADYEKLHREMANYRLQRRIAIGAKDYLLPPGEYFYSGNATGQQVLEWTQAAARSTAKAHAIVATSTASIPLTIGLQVAP